MSPLNLYLILRSMWSGMFISIVTFLELPFGGIDRPGMNRRLYGWAKTVLDLAQVKLVVEGLENLQMVPGERYVVMCNHASYYDIPLSMQVFKDHCSIRMIAKKELFSVPIWGPAMSRAEFVFIDRDDRHQAAKDIERAKGLMETGLVFWIAPEGTRSPDGRLGLFKTGGVKLAMDMGAKIIPLGLEGAFGVMNKGSFKIHRGQTVVARVGKPISTENLAKNQRKQLTAQVREVIRELAHLPPDLPGLGQEEGADA